MFSMELFDGGSTPVVGVVFMADAASNYPILGARRVFTAFPS